MFTPPVGRCSALVCGGKLLCNYIHSKMFLAFRVWVKKNLDNIFGTDSLTEIVPLRLLAGWREEVNRFPLQFAI